MNIFITRPIVDNAMSILQEKGYNIDSNLEDRPLTHNELITQLSSKQYDAVLCLLNDKIDSSVFDASPTTKVFSNYAVGYDNIDLEEAKKRGVRVTNTPDVLTQSVAEYTVALIFACAKRIVEADAFVRAKKYKGWAPQLLLGYELHNKTLGIIGSGRIGLLVARMMNSMGMHIIYYDVKKNEDIEKVAQATYAPLDELIQVADVISIHVPLLPQTHHLISHNHFKEMKKTAILINTSRGPVVEEKALVDALLHNEIAYAGLDVFEYEPKLAEELRVSNKVTVTPHIASATHIAREHMAILSANNIVDVLEKNACKHCVV